MTTQHTDSSASQLRVFSSTSMQASLRELIPQFERENNCQVAIQYDTAKLTLERIASGESADLIILNAEGMEQLAKLGKIDAGSRVDLAVSSIGVAVLAGTPRPAIDTVAAFKQALLDAKAIAYTGAGASGIYFAELIKRLGIAAEVQAKAKVRPGGLIGELVASGEADIAIQQIPELLAVPGIKLVGPLPQEIQVYGILAASVFNHAAQPQLARRLVDFLSTPAAARVFKSKGYLLPERTGTSP